LARDADAGIPSAGEVAVTEERVSVTPTTETATTATVATRSHAAPYSSRRMTTIKILPRRNARRKCVPPPTKLRYAENDEEQHEYVDASDERPTHTHRRRHTRVNNETSRESRASRRSGAADEANSGAVGVLVKQ